MIFIITMCSVFSIKVLDYMDLYIHYISKYNTNIQNVFPDLISLSRSLIILFIIKNTREIKAVKKLYLRLRSSLHFFSYTRNIKKDFLDILYLYSGFYSDRRRALLWISVKTLSCSINKHMLNHRETNRLT